MREGESDSLTGKVAWVTGGAQGLGRAIALALADAGADVAVADTDAQEASKVAENVRASGRRSLLLQVDVADSQQVETLLRDVLASLGRLDIAVNNAGICPVHRPLDCTDEMWRRVIAVNLDATFWCCRAAARHMVERGGGGRIINIASMSVHTTDEPLTHVAYCVAKAGVVRLTQYLAVELGRHGITVNAVSPGNAETSLTPELDHLRDLWIRQTPIPRLATPQEIAAAVVYLAGETAAYVNGHELVIDGGFTCR